MLFRSHTYDIFKEGVSKKAVGTNEFAEAIIKNLNAVPSHFEKVSYKNSSRLHLPKYVRKNVSKKDLVGVDLFMHWTGEDPNTLADLVNELDSENAHLSMITNRGIKVWPEGFKETFCTDHWRCRFMAADAGAVNHSQVIALLDGLHAGGLDFIKTEHLYTFDGEPGFSLGQGQ